MLVHAIALEGTSWDVWCPVPVLSSTQSGHHSLACLGKTRAQWELEAERERRGWGTGTGGGGGDWNTLASHPLLEISISSPGVSLGSLAAGAEIWRYTLPLVIIACAGRQEWQSQAVSQFCLCVRVSVYYNGTHRLALSTFMPARRNDDSSYRLLACSEPGNKILVHWNMTCLNAWGKNLVQGWQKKPGGLQKQVLSPVVSEWKVLALITKTKWLNKHGKFCSMVSFGLIRYNPHNEMSW